MAKKGARKEDTDAKKWLKIYAGTGSITKTAIRCRIAHPTLYRGIKREKEHGESGLSDKSKRPIRLANSKITSEIEDVILAMHKIRDGERNV